MQVNLHFGHVYAGGNPPPRPIKYDSFRYKGQLYYVTGEDLTYYTRQKNEIFRIMREAITPQSTDEAADATWKPKLQAVAAKLAPKAVGPYGIWN